MIPALFIAYFPHKVSALIDLGVADIISWALGMKLAEEWLSEGVESGAGLVVCLG